MYHKFIFPFVANFLIGKSLLPIVKNDSTWFLTVTFDYICWMVVKNYVSHINPHVINFEFVFFTLCGDPTLLYFARVGQSTL